MCVEGAPIRVLRNRQHVLFFEQQHGRVVHEDVDRTNALADRPMRHGDALTIGDV
jgi:hypothetical protein